MQNITHAELWTGEKFIPPPPPPPPLPPPPLLLNQQSMSKSHHPISSSNSSNNYNGALPNQTHPLIQQHQPTAQYDYSDDIDFFSADVTKYFESNLDLVHNYKSSSQLNNGETLSVDETTKAISGVSLNQVNVIPSSISDDSLEIEIWRNQIKSLKTELSAPPPPNKSIPVPRMQSPSPPPPQVQSKKVKTKEEIKAEIARLMGELDSDADSNNHVTDPVQTPIQPIIIEKKTTEIDLDENDVTTRLNDKIKQKYLLSQDSLEIKPTITEAVDVSSLIVTSIEEDVEEIIDLSSTKTDNLSSVVTTQSTTTKKKEKRAKKEKKPKKEKKVKKNKKDEATETIPTSTPTMIDITSEEITEVPPHKHKHKKQHRHHHNHHKKDKSKSIIKKKKQPLGRSQFIDDQCSVSNNGSESESLSDDLGLDEEDIAFKKSSDKKLKRLKKNSEHVPSEDEDEEEDEDEYDPHDPFIGSTDEEEDGPKSSSNDDEEGSNSRSKKKKGFHPNPYMDTRRSYKGLEHIPIIYENTVNSDETNHQQEEEKEEPIVLSDDDKNETPVNTDSIKQDDIEGNNYDDSESMDADLLFDVGAADDIMDIDTSRQESDNIEEEDNTNNNNNFNSSIDNEKEDNSSKSDYTEEVEGGGAAAAASSDFEETNMNKASSLSNGGGGPSRLSRIHEILFKGDVEFKRYFQSILDKLSKNKYIEPILKESGGSTKPIEDMIKIVLIFSHSVLVNKSHDKMFNTIDSRSHLEDKENISKMVEVLQTWEASNSYLIQKEVNSKKERLHPMLPSILYHICATTFEGFHYEKTIMEYEKEDTEMFRCAITNRVIEEGDPVFLAVLFYSLINPNDAISPYATLQQRQLLSSDKEPYTGNVDLLRDVFYVSYCTEVNTENEGYIDSLIDLINFKWYKNIAIRRISEWKKAKFPSVDDSSSTTTANNNNTSFVNNNDSSNNSSNTTPSVPGSSVSQHEDSITTSFTRDHRFIEELVLNYFMLKVLVTTKILTKMEDYSPI